VKGVLSGRHITQTKMAPVVSVVILAAGEPDNCIND
jgi:hypothetical protein